MNEAERVVAVLQAAALDTMGVADQFVKDYHGIFTERLSIPADEYKHLMRSLWVLRQMAMRFMPEGQAPGEAPRMRLPDRE